MTDKPQTPRCSSAPRALAHHGATIRRESHPIPGCCSGKGLTQVPPAVSRPRSRYTPLGKAGIFSCRPGRGFRAPLSYPLRTQRHQPPSEQPCPAASCCTASASSSSPPALPQPSAPQAVPTFRHPRAAPSSRPHRPGRAWPRGLRCSVPGEGPRPRCRRPRAQAAALWP